jgi:hypothetical protein
MRKLLNEAGIKDKDLPWKWNPDDKRKKEWSQERKEYGFDERDSWSLKYTLSLLVYERLKYYRLYAPVEMDDPNRAHTFDFEGKEVVFGEAIDRILKFFEGGFSDIESDWSEEHRKEERACWELLGIIMPGLWW